MKESGGRGDFQQEKWMSESKKKGGGEERSFFSTRKKRESSITISWLSTLATQRGFLCLFIETVAIAQHLDTFLFNIIFSNVCVRYVRTSLTVAPQEQSVFLVRRTCACIVDKELRTVARWKSGKEEEEERENYRRIGREEQSLLAVKLLLLSLRENERGAKGGRRERKSKEWWLSSFWVELSTSTSKRSSVK